MNGRATRIQLFSLASIPMRTFHLAWMGFFGTNCGSCIPELQALLKERSAATA